MNATLIYFLAIAFTIVYSIIEARHDYWLIIDTMSRYGKISKKWHQWGLFQNALAFIPLIVALFINDFRTTIPLTIAIAFLFWQLHDSLIGYQLDKGIFYLGNTSKIDRFMFKVFWNGFNVAIIRIAFFFGCATFDYFRNI
jgi:hypothetical protein